MWISHFLAHKDHEDSEEAFSRDRALGVDRGLWSPATNTKNMRRYASSPVASLGQDPIVFVP